MLVYQRVFASLKATFFSMLHGRSGIQTSTKGRCVQSDGKWTLAVLLSFGDDHQSLHRDIQWYIYIINSHYVITFGFPIWDGGPYPIYQDTIYIYTYTMFWPRHICFQTSWCLGVWLTPIQSHTQALAGDARYGYSNGCDSDAAVYPLVM